MRKGEFRSISPGQLAEIGGGWAFIPNARPPRIAASWPLAARLNAAGMALAKLDGQASLLQNKALVFRPLLTREAIESARLEGTHTHVAGVLLQGAGGAPADPNEAINNREVINYLDASSEGERWLMQGRPLNLYLLRSLHALLLKHTRADDKHPGQFRSAQVFIGSHDDTPETARFVPPPPEQVQPAMEDLLRFMSDADSFPPLISSGIAHYQFETIHPFEDGNGRLGRLLIPLHLMALSAVAQPIVYLSPFFEARRDEYLRLLKGVSTEGDWEAWLSFFLEAVLAQATDARARVERILDLQREYRSRALASGRSKLPAAMIEFILERVVVTGPDVVQHFSCAYNTAIGALETLRKLGIVTPLPDTHPQRWWPEEFVHKVYEA